MTPKRWRDRAEKFRKMAIDTKDPEIRKGLREMIKNCEAIVKSLERQEQRRESGED